MTYEEKKELESIRFVENRLKQKSKEYIKEYGLDAFLSLPPNENFTLNYKKFIRKQELETLELEEGLFDDNADFGSTEVYE